MIHEILSFVILNNTIFQYLVFLLIILGSFYLTKLAYFAFKKIFHVIASKTTSRIDDLLVEALEKPVLFSVFLAGIYYGRRVLILSDSINSIFSKSFTSLIVLLIAWFLLKILDAIMMNYFSPSSSSSIKLNESIYPILSKLLNFVILIITFLWIVQNLGYQVTSLIAGLGIGGLAFALAAQDVLSNMFGGAAILSDKPFKIGNRILVDGIDGFVKQIGLRSTVLETWDGTKVIIPNKKMADSVVENISVERARRVKLVLGLEYSTTTKKLNQAKKILSDLVLKNKSTDDKSLVNFVGFNSSSLDLQVIYWIKDLDRILETKDEINFAIKEQFEKNKINFAYPFQTIYLKK
ncbi:MAG: mechanosensitive ion channel family protein [Candidatus Nanoarchaeia archaeon]|nr:mechanosensitive ion channel family protein [Candidatus Nanoarchaeia archaeon]